tara:strand:+ start:2373 stop:2774 length:402 start_codon:yes stop_codon:yes gene_type:complete
MKNSNEYLDFILWIRNFYADKEIRSYNNNVMTPYIYKSICLEVDNLIVYPYYGNEKSRLDLEILKAIKNFYADKSDKYNEIYQDHTPKKIYKIYKGHSLIATSELEIDGSIQDLLMANGYVINYVIGSIKGKD